MKAGNHIFLCGLLLTFFSALYLPRLIAENRNEAANTDRPPAATNSESFENLALRAEAALNANRLPEATRLYEQAVRLRPRWAEGWWHLGTLAFDSGRFSHARDAFLEFVEVEKRQPGPGFGMLGLSDFHLRDYSGALVAFERGRKLGLGSNPDFVHSVLYHTGIVYSLLGQPELALDRLTLLANQIAAAHPEAPKEAVLGDSDVVNALGIAALRIAKLPSDVPGRQAPLIARAGRAQALIALQDRVAAEEELKEFISQYPSEPGVHYMYGVFLLKEHPPLAIDEFRRELQVAPRNDAAYTQLALEFLRIGQYDEGLKCARQATALAPRNFVAHVACGRLWLALGGAHRAVEELRTAVKLAPGSPDAHFALSRALSQTGQNAEAARERAEFERLQKISESASR